MEDAITDGDKDALIKFIQTSDRFTQGPKVEEFERAWADWLGCEYALFVTSGSTANLLLLAAVKEYFKLSDGDKVLVPACTWVTSVSPVFQIGLTPIFCDINLNDYSFDTTKLPDEDIKVVFLTHLLGFDGPVEAVKEKYPNAIFLEDICESHGVTDPNMGLRRGRGVGSTFSFYYGHHMTTIEGGMVCTNNKGLYELMRLKRSHGMARHLLPENFEGVCAQYPNLDPSFLFLTDGYNFRNTELNAVLGVSQLKRLDINIRIRQNNWKHFHDRLKQNASLFTVPEFRPNNSCYAFPFVCLTPGIKKNLVELFTANDIEFRPIVAGNLLLHPFLKKWHDPTLDLHNANILNDNGLYIGNNQFINKETIDKVFDLIESIYDDK